MSDLPARIAVWPDFVGHPSMTGQWSANTHPDNAVAYVRADLSYALLREARGVLDYLAGNPTRATAVFDAARATLAKLKAHLGEKE